MISHSTKTRSSRTRHMNAAAPQFGATGLVHLRDKDILSSASRKFSGYRCAHAGLQKRQFFWGRHECMGVDLLGKFVAVDGMTHVCHVTDFATGFIFCIPIPDKEAVTVAAVLHKHVFMFAGWPKKLVSDQGGGFCNKLQKVLARLFSAHEQKATGICLQRLFKGTASP